MENDAFNIPQKQSKIGILLLTIINFGKFLRGIWPLVLILFFRGEKTFNFLIIIFITIFILAILGSISYLQYISFTYFINSKNEEFVIQKGIINKKTISLEKNKIQEVNINQPFIHRLLNIYQLEIDSPGSDKKEVTLQAVSYKNAIDLKNYLLENRVVAHIEDATKQKANTDEKENIIISTLSLLKYAVTANYLRSVVGLVAFGFYIADQIKDVLRSSSKLQDYLPTEQEIEDSVSVESLKTFSILTLILIVFGLLILAIIINVVRNLIKYYSMKITKREDQLSLHYGLLHTKNAIVNRHKAQMISINQNYLQKKMDIQQLKINQIAKNETDKDSAVIPGCSNAEKQKIEEFIWKEIPRYSFHLQPNFRKLIANNFVFIIPPLFVGLLVKPLLGNYFSYIWIYVIIVELLLVVSFLQNRLFFNENFISLRSGIWDITQQTTQIEKIQSIKISQYFWQRKSNLGAIKFFTAGGNIVFTSTDFKCLKKLMNYTLFKIETSHKSWM